MVSSMKSYNKEFEYKGYRFNIKVELNTKIEKQLDGKLWHTIAVNDMGPSNYYRKFDVLDFDLTTGISNAIDHAKAHVDDKTQLSTAEKTLINLGFM